MNENKPLWALDKEGITQDQESGTLPWRRNQDNGGDGGAGAVVITITRYY